LSTEVLKTITDPPKNFQVFEKEKKDLSRTLLGFRDLPGTLLQEHLFLGVFLVWTYRTVLKSPRKSLPKSPRIFRGLFEDFLKPFCMSENKKPSKTSALVVITLASP